MVAYLTRKKHQISIITVYQRLNYRGGHYLHIINWRQNTARYISMYFNFSKLQITNFVGVFATPQKKKIEGGDEFCTIFYMKLWVGNGPPCIRGKVPAMYICNNSIF